MTELAYSTQAGELHTLGVSALGTSFAGRSTSRAALWLLLCLRHSLYKTGWTTEVSSYRQYTMTELMNLIKIDNKSTRYISFVIAEMLMEFHIAKGLSFLVTYSQTRRIEQ
jgi:hypothetical protein